MKYFFYFFLFAAFSVNSFACLSDYTLYNFNVGKQPGAVYYDQSSQKLHILCMGNDDWDSTPEDGEETPSWYVIDNFKIGDPSLSTPQKVKEFEFSSFTFPVRYWFDKEEELLFITQKGAVASYKLSDYTLVDENVAPYSANAISRDGDFLYLTIAPYFESGKVVKYNYKTKTAVDSVINLNSPKQTLPYWNGSLAILTEGTFGEPDSQVLLYDVSGEQMELIEAVTVGITGNHISHSGDYMYASMNGSHDVKVIDLNSRAVVDTLTTPTKDLNGPRETVAMGYHQDYLSDFIITTTYAGMLYEYENKILIDSIETHGKAEAITLDSDMGTAIFFTNINIKGTYDADSVVSVLYSPFGSVSENTQNNVSVYPNPIDDKFNFIFYSENEMYDISIFNLLGENIVSTKALSSNGRIELSARSLNLNQGTYFAVITNGKMTYNSKIIVK